MVTNHLYRSRADHMVAGVCGGLGQYFGVDPTIVRLFFVIATILTGGLMIPVYGVMWLVVPDEPFGLFEASPFPNTSGSETPDPLETPSTGETPRFGPTGSVAGGTRFGTPTSYEQIHHRRQWIGWSLVALGALVLMANLNLLSWLNLHATWPAFLILAGFLMLFRQRSRF